MESEMSWVEVGLNWVDVDGAGWRCLEMDGAG